jgi:hypothetical protein
MFDYNFAPAVEEPKPQAVERIAASKGATKVKPR